MNKQLWMLLFLHVFKPLQLCLLCYWCNVFTMAWDSIFNDNSAQQTRDTIDFNELYKICPLITNLVAKLNGIDCDSLIVWIMLKVRIS